MGPHSLTLDLSLEILGKETVVLSIKGNYSVIRNGVTPIKLSRAYDRLWDSLDYDGDHRHLEGVTRASVSSVLSELQETIERYENGSDTARNNARLASKTEAHEAARRARAGLRRGTRCRICS